MALTKGVTADFRTYYSHGRIEIDASGGDTSEYALKREFVGYGGLNIDLLEGRSRNRFGYGYPNTSRDNYNPARSRPQTFDSAGPNERLEYHGSLSITQGLTALFGHENERSRFRRSEDRRVGKNGVSK